MKIGNIKQRLEVPVTVTDRNPLFYYTLHITIVAIYTRDWETFSIKGQIIGL